MKITRIEMHPVVVPARANAVNSPGKNAPLHMLSVGGRQGWSTQFDELTKHILFVHTDEGLTGVGETLRDVRVEKLVSIASSLIGLDVLEMQLRDLPIPYGREYDGFEIAIHDLVARAHCVPIHRLFGGTYRDRVYCSAWFGQRTPDDAGDWAAKYQAQGYNALKFKGSLAEDPVEICQSIRARCGPNFRVIIDPNARWERPAEVKPFLRRLEACGNVWMLEDPIPRWDLRNWRHLREATTIPLALHTAIPYVELFQKPQDVVLALQEGACDYFNFNGPMAWIAKLGAVAEIANIPFWHGSEVDLGILEASYLHIAAAQKMCTLPSDIFGRMIREHDLLATPLEYDGDSHFVVPTGPGLGVDVDTDALERYRAGETLIFEADGVRAV